MYSAPRDLHPWRRFFARLVDVLLYMFVGGFVVGFLEGFVGTHWSAPIKFIGLLIAAVLLESILLSSWGTTPCRWLFGIKVRTATGAKLSSDTAFKRTALVYVLGDGLSIPGVNLIFNLIGYWRLTTAGTTWWDKAAGTQVTHTPWKPLRAVLCVAVVIGAIFVTSTSNKVVSTLSSVGANSSTIEVMPQGVALKPVQVTMTCYRQGDPRRLFADADCAVVVHNKNERWVVRAFDVDLGSPGWMNRANGIADRRYPFSANVLPLETRSYRMVTGLPEPHSFDWTVNNMVGSAPP